MTSRCFNTMDMSGHSQRSMARRRTSVSHRRLSNDSVSSYRTNTSNGVPRQSLNPTSSSHHHHTGGRMTIAIDPGLISSTSNHSQRMHSTRRSSLDHSGHRQYGPKVIAFPTGKKKSKTHPKSHRSVIPFLNIVSSPFQSFKVGSDKGHMHRTRRSSMGGNSFKGHEFHPSSSGKEGLPTVHDVTVVLRYDLHIIPSLRRFWLPMCIILGCIVGLTRNLGMIFVPLPVEGEVYQTTTLTTTLTTTTTIGGNEDVGVPANDIYEEEDFAAGIFRYGEDRPSIEEWSFWDPVRIGNLWQRKSDGKKDTDSSTTMKDSFKFLFYDPDAMNQERHLYRIGDTKVSPLIQYVFDTAADIVKANNVSDAVTSFLPIYSDSNGTVQYSENTTTTIPPNNIIYDMQYNITVLGLAYFLSGQGMFAEIAVSNIRTWFLDSKKKLSPHLWLPSPTLATVEASSDPLPPGSPRTFGVELTELHYFLDGVQMVWEYLETKEMDDLRFWFGQYLESLQHTSSTEKKKTEQTQPKNEGLNKRLLSLSLQQFAVSNFLGKNMTSFWKDVTQQQKGDVEKMFSMAETSADGNHQKQEKCETTITNSIDSLHLWWTLARLKSYRLRQDSSASSKKEKVVLPWEEDDFLLCRASSDVLFESLKTCSSKEESVLSSPKYSEVVMDASMYCQPYWSKGKNSQFWAQLQESNSKKRGKDKSEYDILKKFPENRYDLFWSSSKANRESIQKGMAPFWTLGWMPSVMPLEKEERPRYVAATSVGVWKKPVKYETRKKTDKPKKKVNKSSIKMPLSFTEKNSNEKKSLRNDDTTKPSPTNTKGSSGTTITTTIKDGPVTISTSITNVASTTTSKILKDLGNMLLPVKSTPLLTAKTDEQQLVPPQRVMSLSDIIRRNRPNAKITTTRSPLELVLPSVLKKAARTDPKYQYRLERIQHWHRLGQHKIVKKMVQKALQELMGSSGYER